MISSLSKGFNWPAFYNQFTVLGRTEDIAEREPKQIILDHTQRGYFKLGMFPINKQLKRNIQQLPKRQQHLKCRFYNNTHCCSPCATNTLNAAYITPVYSTGNTCKRLLKFGDKLLVYILAWPIDLRKGHVFYLWKNVLKLKILFRMGRSTYSQPSLFLDALLIFKTYLMEYFF